MTRSLPPLRRSIAFTLVELLVVIGILTLLIGVLLPTLARMRQNAASRSLAAGEAAAAAEQRAGAPADGQARPAAPPPLMAHVFSFSADVGLTPRLSVGTAEPESIYEATFKAQVVASHPGAVEADAAAAAATGAGAGAAAVEPCELHLPLPPQVISLAGVSVNVDGRKGNPGALALRDGRLVWRGRLAADAPAVLDVQYAATGKGLYTLQPPPGDVLDAFRINLTTHGSDLRMLDGSLQPTDLRRAGGGATTYTWDYARLLFGRPIALDVLGIAPVDRLGQLRWLGPLSVVVFGMLVGLVARGFDVQRFDRWTLLLVLGTFTAAYPLMYFAQEFIRLPVAATASVALALAVIGWRAVGIMRPRLAVFGLVVPAALIMLVTLACALHPRLQGLLLTAEAMAFLVLAMVLMPKSLPAPDEAPTVALA